MAMIASHFLKGYLFCAAPEGGAVWTPWRRRECEPSLVLPLRLPLLSISLWPFSSPSSLPYFSSCSLPVGHAAKNIQHFPCLHPIKGVVQGEEKLGFAEFLLVT